MAVRKTVDRSIEDLAHGQVVLVTARWILVAAALAFTLWNPGDIDSLRVQVAVMLLLAFGNFYLNLELFRRRTTLKAVVYGASAADLAVITLYVISQGGFESNAFIFYFPALLALSVAFPTAVTFWYSAAVIGFYALVCLTTLPPGAEIAETANLQALVARLLMLTAVAFCGNQYRRIEMERRSAAEKTHEELMARIREHDSQPV